MKTLTAFLLVVAAMWQAHAQTKLEKTAMKKAAFDLSCPAENVKVARSSNYPGGALVVITACDKIGYYECMGTVCQTRCVYTPKSTDFTGAGESDGKFHKLVMDRAGVEFEAAADDVKQVKHLDGKGQGTYVLAVKGNEVTYECYGSVCNLKCQ